MPSFKSILYWLLCSKTIIPGIDLHNQYRNSHHAQPLNYDPAITQAAQAYADYLARNGLFQHGMLTDAKGRHMGQNLFAVWNTVRNDSDIIKMAVRNWYKESGLYNYNNPRFSIGTGHFTQLVWNSTNLIGIGIATLGNKKIVVADYYPPGNVENRFRQNVFPI